MKALKLDTLSRNGIPSRAIIVSAIVVCISAFINVLPGVSDAFALITASSSGVYIAIYILTMLAHLKYRKSQEFMADGFLMPAYKILNPLTILFFIFVLFVSSCKSQQLSELLEQPSGLSYLVSIVTGNTVNKSI